MLASKALEDSFKNWRASETFAAAENIKPISSWLLQDFISVKREEFQESLVEKI